MSGYTPYYSGGWQSGESGGTPITPAALNNMENGIGAALTAADVVNNLNSTATNKPLSAAQGKALNDAMAIDFITDNYTNKDSHIESFNARKSGKIISISFSLTSGLTNETVLFNVPTGLKSVSVNYIGPLFVGSSGTMYTNGGVWMEISNRDRVMYYGNTTTERLWCSMTYMCE